MRKSLIFIHEIVLTLKSKLGFLDCKHDIVLYSMFNLIKHRIQHNIMFTIKKTKL